MGSRKGEEYIVRWKRADGALWGSSDSTNEVPNRLGPHGGDCGPPEERRSETPTSIITIARTGPFPRETSCTTSNSTGLTRPAKTSV